MRDSKECPVLIGAAAWLVQYLLLSAAIIFVCGSWVGAAHAAAPDVWPTHNDPLGFSVRHPPNWVAEAVQNELSRVRSADGAMFILVQPFFARDGETAAGKVGEVPTKLTAVLPNATIANVRQASYQPDEVIAEISFDDGGRPGRALALCLVDGRSGMFYAIAAPAQTFDKVRPVLIDILDTFTFTTPTAPPVAGGGVNFVTWHEPNEAAFTLEVPQGWEVSGGLYRTNALDVRPDVQISSPDGQIFFRIGDQDVPPFITPSSMLNMTGFTEGSWYSYMGMTWMVRSYVGGLDFAREYLMQHLPDGCTDATITQERERDDLSQPINDIYARYNLYGSSIVMSMGEVAAECQSSGQPVVLYCFAGIKLTQTPPETGIWTVDYLIYGFAAAEQQDTAKAILGHIANSYQPNLDWMRRQSELAGAVGDIVAKTGAEIREIMRQTFEASSQVRDDAARRWSNMILGMTDVRDPITGEEWRVANGHNYYWRKGDTIVGTDIDRPNVDFTPLVEF